MLNNNNSPLVTSHSWPSVQEEYQSLPFGYENYIDERTLTRFKREVARARRNIQAEKLRLTRHTGKRSTTVYTSVSMKVSTKKSNAGRSVTQPSTAVVTPRRGTPSNTSVNPSTRESVIDEIIQDARNMRAGAVAQPVTLKGLSGKSTPKSLQSVASKRTAPPPAKKSAVLKRPETSKSKQSITSTKSTASSAKRSRSKTPSLLVKIRNRIILPENQKRTVKPKSAGKPSSRPDTATSFETKSIKRIEAKSIKSKQQAKAESNNKVVRSSEPLQKAAGSSEPPRKVVLSTELSRRGVQSSVPSPKAVQHSEPPQKVTAGGSEPSPEALQNSESPQKAPASNLTNPPEVPPPQLETPVPEERYPTPMSGPAEALARATLHLNISSKCSVAIGKGNTGYASPMNADFKCKTPSPKVSTQ